MMISFHPIEWYWNVYRVDEIHLKGHGTLKAAVHWLTVCNTYVLPEYLGSAVHFWNSPTKKCAVKRKMKAADFLPWKAETPLSCNRQQRQCPWLSPWASQRNGKWQQREVTTPPRGSGSSRAVPGPVSWFARIAAALKGHALPCSLEQPPELEPTPFP